MKKYLLSMLMLMFCFSLTSQESELEKYKKSQKEDIDQWKQERDAELDAYKERVEKERKEWQEYVNSVRKKWGEFSDTTPKVWSNYGNDLNSLGKVDFDNNKVEIAALIETDDPKKAEELMEKQLEILLNEKEQGTNKNFMENQIAFEKMSAENEKKYQEKQKEFEDIRKNIERKAAEEKKTLEDKRIAELKKMEQDRLALEEKMKQEKLRAEQDKKAKAEQKALDLKKQEIEKRLKEEKEAEAKKKALEEQKRIEEQRKALEKQIAEAKIKEAEEQKKIQEQKASLEKKELELKKKLEEEKAKIEKAEQEKKKELKQKQEKEEQQYIKTVSVSNADDLIKEKIKKDIKKEVVVGEDGKARTKFSVTLDMVPNSVQKRAENYLDMVKTYSEKNELDPSLVLALIHTESAFNPKAFSRRPDGTPMACGLMQIIPSQAGRDAHKALYGKDKIVESDYLFDPDNNLKMGTWYLKNLSKWWVNYENKNFKKTSSPEKNEYLAISSYNQGMGTILNKSYKANKLIDKSDEETYAILTTDKNIPKEGRDYLQRVADRKKLYKKD
jgi:membrane-bound lytic murein transglycosylase C